MSSEADSAARRGPIAIQVRGLTKIYPVYSRARDRLRQVFWGGRRRFYSDFLAVHDVDLDVQRGETLGVVGRNGSGKSTLLRMICGTLEPTAGTVSVAGHVAPLLTLGTGFDPEFTGRENVFMNAAILGLSDAEIRERLDAIIAFADIGEFFDRSVKSYSSGMYSRLAFAVAIHSDPEILVVDEILAVGDEAFNRKCFARIEEIKAKSSTILFASHSASTVIELCDRAILMERGERLLTADPKTVVSHYHRLTDAAECERTTILRQIRELDAVAWGESLGADPRPLAGSEAPRPDAGHGPFGYFAPQLLPESKLEYPSRGVQIHSVRILDPEGSPVNVLSSRVVYTYAYEVEFHEEARSVRFGMLVKLVSGFELGGQVSHPPGQGMGRVAAGSRAQVRFSFRPSIEPGTYFLNAGVVGLLAGEEVYLHRILDAAVFRIEPDEPGRVTGVVDLTVSEPPRVMIETDPLATPNGS